jgi:acyl dehydratase
MSTVPAGPVTLRDGDVAAPESRRALTRTDFVRYAGASGDFHPIHHDEVFAKEAGAPSVFGMGLLHGGMLAGYLARWVGPHNIRSYSLRFLAQVWPGDELTLSGRVEEIADDAEEPCAVVALEAISSRGETVARARATVATA